ncbi:MMPL family transporter [Nocardioides albus]|uniref:RND superfamily putative drug exporter n=1 Tax=Nocardioides albus TaxID=1841 RepID=A0A7W5F7Z0_9ACTN|nr:MMPL family transporter [Nocardioides albus]MBB3088628.1 RND superfamily putative drug exporter [Nocardioides albus]
MRSAIERLARVTTRKATAWVVLVIAVLLAGSVMAVGSSLGSASSAPDPLPADAESAQVAELQQSFPGGDVLPAVAVVERTGGLTAEDREWVAEVSRRWAEITGNEVSPPIPAADGEALIVAIDVDADVTGLDLTELVDELREAADEDRPDGLTVQLTGGAAFAADISSAFEGADLRLLLVTAGVVALLLILTYRSPVLWLVPLTVIAVADRTASVATQIVADWTGSGLDGSTSGITSVLVFGAGTNYALLMVSRYREELRRHAHHRDALAAAVRGSTEAIVASNVTVVLALLVLTLSVAPNTRALGVSAAIGLLIALLFALFALPAALSLFGRGLFWPFIPRNGEDEKSRDGVWFRIARAVVSRPAVVLAAAAVILGVLASGLLGVKVGLSQTDQFRVDAESVDGLETLSKHFPPGAADPVTIVVPANEAEEVLATVNQIDGVDSARPSGESGDLVKITATLEDAPATAESIETIETMRSELDRTGALVGGSVAQDLDSRNGAVRDLKVIVPLILLVVLLVLFVVLRSIVTPLVLVTISVIATLSALGLGAWMSTHVFGFPALDVSTPLYAFLFLVALGIDYTVFLVLRAREETAEHNTVDAMVMAVGLTGGVITSAGIVLASVFAVLGVLPLITLTQVGLIVGLGILLDTFLVRTVVVPAVFALVGDRIWWPAAIARRRQEPSGG